MISDERLEAIAALADSCGITAYSVEAPELKLGDSNRDPHQILLACLPELISEARPPQAIDLTRREQDVSNMLAAANVAIRVLSLQSLQGMSIPEFRGPLWDEAGETIRKVMKFLSTVDEPAA